MTTTDKNLFTSILMVFLFIGVSGCCRGIDSSCAGDSNGPNTDGSPLITTISVPVNVVELSTVTLTATAEDPDGDSLNFAWKQISGPDVHDLKGVHSTALQFTVPKIVGTQSIGFELTVSDGGNTGNAVREVLLEVKEGSGLIFLEKTTGGGSALYRHHQNDGIPVELGNTQLEVSRNNVRISPDRRYVAYKEGDYIDEANQRLHIVRMDGNGSRSLPDVSLFSISPDSRYIAYEQGQQLHVADLDGSERVHVTVDVGDLDRAGSDALSWSADSQTLAFLKISSSSKRSLHVLSLSDGDAPVVRRVSPESADLNGDGEEDTTVLAFRWSPTANQIAFSGEFTRTGVRELRVAPALSTNPLDDVIDVTGQLNVPDDCTCHPLAPYNDIHFEWSPDGRNVAFVTEAAGSDIYDLFLVPVVGSHAYARTNMSGPLGDRDGDGFADSSVSFAFWASNFVWSPQSDAIAFVSDRDTAGVEELFVASIDQDGGLNGILKVSGEITASDEDSTNGTVDGDVSLALLDWSPTGTQLAFAGDLLTDEVAELFIVDWSESSAGERRLISGPVIASDGALDNGDIDGDVIYSKWSPKGGRIAFAGDLDTDRILDLYVTETSAGTRSKLSGLINPPNELGNPTFDIGFGSANDIEWSLDGQQIAFRADYIEQFRRDVFVISANSQDAARDRRLVSDEGYGFRWFGPSLTD